jgi:ATP/maltotriose-dependent transcriptional regulator MalT
MLQRQKAESRRQIAYFDKLFSAFPQSLISNLQSQQPLVEPLSDRELEVLNLMANGATNQQIADELVVAKSTAKKHVSNIIGKLGVENRTTAVARARELNLI